MYIVGITMIRYCEVIVRNLTQTRNISYISYLIRMGLNEE